MVQDLMGSLLGPVLANLFMGYHEKKWLQDYQFICAGCKACYIGETKCHLNTRIEEHLGKDKKSHIYSHLQENPQCQERVNFDCFEIIDCASSYFRLQIKEAMHIN